MSWQEAHKFSKLFVHGQCYQEAKYFDMYSSVSESKSYFSLYRKPTSTYSSSSLVESRSCLSKSSTGSKNINGVTRFVTFYPTIVLLNEECHPCEEKCLHIMENAIPESKFPLLSIITTIYKCLQASIG